MATYLFFSLRGVVIYFFSIWEGIAKLIMFLFGGDGHLFFFLLFFGFGRNGHLFIFYLSGDGFCFSIWRVWPLMNSLFGRGWPPILFSLCKEWPLIYFPIGRGWPLINNSFHLGGDVWYFGRDSHLLLFLFGRYGHLSISLFGRGWPTVCFTLGKGVAMYLFFFSAR